MGDTFNFSGQFTQSVINVKTTMTHAAQSVGTLPRLEAGPRQELQTLIDKLGAALGEAASAKSDEAAAAADATKELVELVRQEKPNKATLTIKLNGLKQAVDMIADAAPAAVAIAARIGEIITTFF
jgi:ElaB/YqjD/DUF883 family membrane-anchored ribosome-binding protein